MDHVETSIRERAYALWERDGRASGRDAHYWHLAERELAAQASQPVTEVAAAEAIVATPVRKAAARKPAAPKAPAPKAPVTKSAAAKTVAEVAEAAAKPAPRRRRAAAASENVTTH